MKKMWLWLTLALLALSSVGCDKITAGNVGIKVNMLGSDKGVQEEVLGVGRVWIGVNEELYIFPTFTQNYVWTKAEDEGSPNDESISFQTKEGLSVNGDFGISYHIEPANVSKVFQKYRRGVDEITDIFLRNMVRDALNKTSSTKPVDYIYGAGKARLMEEVDSLVRSQTDLVGISLEKISLIGDLRLPDQVTQAINKKIDADQQALEAIATARKMVEGARGDSLSTVIKATGEATAIMVKQEALRNAPQLIQYEIATGWDGRLPLVTGTGSGQIIDLGAIMNNKK